MAITLVTAGTQATASATPLTQNLPGTHASGDTLVSMATVRSTGSLTVPPSGSYTNITTTGATTIRIYSDRKTDGGSETAPAYTATSVDSTHKAFGWMAAFRGVLTASDPLDGTPALGSGTATDVTIPALTVNTDNCVVICHYGFQSTATQPTAPAGWTWGGFASTATGGNYCDGWLYQIQGAKANISSTAIGLIGGGSNTTRVEVFALKSAVVAPTFSVSPTVVSQTDTAYTIGYTASTASTFYTVAVAAGHATPTAAQIKAGTGGGILFAANEAVTGADTTVLTITGTPFPKYKVCSLLSNAAGDTSIVALDNQSLNEPTGIHYFTADVPWDGADYSIFEGASPAVVDGDIGRVPTTTIENSLAITWNVDGTFLIDAGAVTARQHFLVDVYDVSAEAYMGQVTVWVNDQAPIEFNDIPESFDWLETVVIPSVTLSNYIVDPEGDVVTYAIQSGSLPTGVSLTTGVVSGTPANGQVGTYTVVIRATAATGTFADFTFPFQVFADATVPNVVTEVQATAQADLTAASLGNEVIYATSDSVAIGVVISQDIPAATIVPVDTVVTITVSLGRIVISGRTMTRMYRGLMGLLIGR